jgi:phenylacetate-CoA ligase
MLAQLVDEEGLGDLSPRGIICHGELLPQEIGREIARAFRCPVWNQYGAQEFNRLGWDCARHEGLHLDADSVVLEVVGPDGVVPDGVEGDLVFSGLHNDLMPLVRYRIGDLGRVLSAPCSCGRGLPLFEVTEGRADDVLLLPGQKRIGPRTLAPRIEALDGFSQYRVVQKERDRLEVWIVRDPGAPEGLLGAIERTVREVVGEGVRIAIRPVDEIPLSRRGKLRKVVSEVPAGV